MNIPNLPTDNLYKFIALFGLILYISSTYFYIKNNFDYSNYQNENIAKIEHLNSLILEAESTKNLRIKLMKDSLSFNGKFFDMVNNEEEYLLRKIDEFSPKFYLLKNEIESRKFEFELLNKILLFSIILSVFILYIGFHLWYHKIQKHIDLEFKLDYLKNLKEYNKLTKKKNS